LVERGVAKAFIVDHREPVGLVPGEGDHLAVEPEGVAPAHIRDQRQGPELRDDGAEPQWIG